MKAQLKGALRQVLRDRGWELRRVDTTLPTLTERLERIRVLGIQPRTVVDVGAAVGNFSWECAQVFPNARYVMIEPLEEFTEPLRKRVNELGATHVQAVATDEEGSLTLHVHRDLVGSSLLREAEAGIDGTPREVPAVTVDAVAEGLPGPFLLKADVQGAELRVMDSASRVLSESAIVMLEAVFMEFFPDGPLFHEVIAYMAERGFLVYDVVQPLYRPLDGALSQVDLLFVPRDGPLRMNRGYATPAQRAISDAQERPV